MIALIYQHKGDYPFSELENCINNLIDYVVDKDNYCISLVIDGQLSLADTVKVKSLLKNFQNSEFSQTGEHIGISKARIKAVTQIIGKYNISNLLFCCTNSKFITKLDKRLHDILIQYKGLTALKYKCDDWLYKRDFSAENYDVLPIDYFISIQNKPDYLMMVDIDSYVLVSPFKGEKYISEEIDWYKQCIDTKSIRIAKLQISESWFNIYGMTASNKDRWRQMEIDNSESFFYKAEFFLDLFLKGEIVLNIRQLKDYCSTLVSNHKCPIPFKKYKGTIIEPLLIERLKSWAENNNFDNTFKIYEEK